MRRSPHASPPTSTIWCCARVRRSFILVQDAESLDGKAAASDPNSADSESLARVTINVEPRPPTYDEMLAANRQRALAADRPASVSGAASDHGEVIEFEVLRQRDPADDLQTST